MNSFVAGMFKAAMARGLSEKQAIHFIKEAIDLTEGAPGPQGGFDPSMPDGQGGFDPSMPDGQGGEPAPDELLANMSPEEIDQLAAALAGSMQGQMPEGQDVPDIDDEGLNELAQAIEAHMAAQQAGGPMGGGVKTSSTRAALPYYKQAEYIHAFLGRALEHGLNVKTAVDTYEQAVINTDLTLNQAQQTTAQAKDQQVKTAAYYAGLTSRAAEYGLSTEETINLVSSMKNK